MTGRQSSRHCAAMLLIAGVLFCTACRHAEEPPAADFRKDPPAEKQVLKVEPSSLHFDAGGGTQRLFITAENCEWSAIPDAEWLTVTENQGTSSAEISVTAAPNPANESRNGSVTVTGPDAAVCRITAEQKGAETPATDPIDLEQATAFYLGDRFQTGGKLDNIRVEMSGADPSSADYSTMEIILDLNIPATTFADAELAGSYTANLSDTPSCGTFNSAEATRIIRHDTDGHALDPLYTVGGHVEILRTNDLYRIDLTLKTGDGTPFAARYEGPISFIDGTSAPHSTLTEDVQPAVLRATGLFSSYADMETEAKKLVLQFYSDLSVLPVENMMWTLNVEPQAAETGAIEGIYKVIEKPAPALAAEDLQAGTIVAGAVSEDEAGERIFSGSWYRRLTAKNGQAELTAFAPFASGEVTISRKEERYTIDYRFTDDNPLAPHTISGSYTGTIDFQNLGE